ncbi:hypothetical protein HK100_010447 [Physocladia obscura]|uniref:Uncharacterized protein n=1 Tax=Physocladia obscura TaxID=109957 RepID=A0AAD5T2Z7_9FUNG|nr:hypothetical protein HK100_010447 [Physocladia obscura]
MNVGEFTAGNKAHKDTKRHSSVFKIPITVFLLAQLTIALACITIPLGYIALSSSSEITSDLTPKLIESVVKQATDGVSTVLNQVTLQARILVKEPSLEYLINYQSSNFSQPQNNFTRTVINNMQENPYLLTIFITAYGNTSKPENVGQIHLGMQKAPCIAFGRPNLGTQCYGRLYENTGSNYGYLQLVDPSTGNDLGKSEKSSCKVG